MSSTPFAASQLRQMMTPAESMAEVQSVRDMMQKNALGAEQLTAARLSNAQAQLAADRQNGFAQSMTDFASNGLPGAPSRPAGPAPQTAPQWQPSDGGPNTSSVLSTANAPPPMLSMNAPPASLAAGGALATMKKPGAAPGMDYAGMANLAFKAGLPDKGFEFLKAGADANAKTATARKENAEAGHFDAQVSQMHMQQLGQASQALLSTDDTTAAAMWPQVRSDLIASGHDPAEVPAQYPGRQAIQQYASQAQDVSQQLSSHIAAQEEARKAQLFPSQLDKSAADAATANVTAGQMGNLGMTQDQRETLDAAAKRDAQTAKNEAARTGIAGAELGIKQKTFDATIGAGLDANGQPVIGPDGKPIANPVAAAMANYRLPPPATRSLATPMGQNLMRQILAIDPSYDGTQFPARSKTAADYSAGGASGKALVSADTALAHLKTISDAGKALSSGNIPALNNLANSLGVQIGQDPKTTYDTVVGMVSPEISKAVIGAAGGEAERMGMAKNFSSSASAAQREGAIGSAATLLGARVDKSRHAYETTMGKPLAWDLSPQSKDTLTRYSGGGGAGVKVTDPNGGVHTFPDQGKADAFKKAAGIQ